MLAVALALLCDAALVGDAAPRRPVEPGSGDDLRRGQRAHVRRRRSGSSSHNPHLLLTKALEQLELSGAALGLALVVALPLGIVLGHLHRGSGVAIGTSIVGRALPSIFLIAVFLTILGLGFTNNMVALAVLALGPILTNAYLGVEGVDGDAVEAARGMGLSGTGILTRVELPLALPLLYIGIRVAAVTVVATAPIAAYAGGGGLGDIIANQATYRLSGVLGASICVMALSAGVWIGLLALQRATTPKGVRAARVRGGRGTQQGGAVIRKHTRRAAKAAFAISFGVAIVLGGFAGTARSATARRADDRDRHQELLRGVHPRRALQAGARGEGLQRLVQGEHRLDGDHPDGAHEREDQLLSRVHGRDRPGRVPQDEVSRRRRRRPTRSRRSSRRPRASRCSTPTPFYDTDVLAVTNATAKKYGLKTISDLKKVGAFKLGGFPECQTRNTCFVGYTKQYGLSNATFASVGSVSPYAALDSGSVLAADVFSTDPPLAQRRRSTRCSPTRSTSPASRTWLRS